jgi:Histidine kinase-, DNA gyrase B-, and HSP90-like ATPase
MSSLRDIGYDLPSAVADIVDNSIDAGASTIRVDLVDHGVDSYLRVTDNGIGMTWRQLDEAMRYGSSSTYATDALGHFGLGLKTGSLSQCRRLTVASRSHRSARIAVRRWDLDVVSAEDAWVLETPGVRERPGYLLDPIQDGCGTVVLWEKLDRVLAFRRPTSGNVSRALDSLSDEIRAHLAMVFHRFISGESSDGRRPVDIVLNGRALIPWDPFARSEPRTRALATQEISLDDAGDGVSLCVTPYVLPAQTEFSSTEAHQAAAGPNRWNRQQGFYIYRRERLIQSGGWNRLRTLDEHAKLARIAIDLPVGHEHLFGINVAKMSVSLPEAVRPELRAIASGVVQLAQRRYREVEAGEPVHGVERERDVIRGHVSELRIGGDWPAISAAVHRVLTSDTKLRDRVLLELANAGP